MRVLVDECLPRQLAAVLSGHDASTVREQRWLKLRNGVLLRAAVDAGFQVFITNDGSLEFQQNIRKIGIAVIVISGDSNEQNEPPHIHVKSERKLAKFWVDPVELAGSKRFAAHELREIESIVVENRQMFLDAWNDHFDS